MMEQKEDRSTRLAEAVKKNDSWWTTIFPAKAANRVVSIIGDTEITPNQVTVFSFFLALITGACLWQGTHSWLIIAAILIQVQFILDCVDGQLARYKNMSSLRGGWLDLVVDRFKDFIYFFSLCRGHYAVNGQSDIWVIGFVAYFISSTTVHLYVARSKFIEPESISIDRDQIDSSQEAGGEKSLIEKIYEAARKNAYFLSFSLPDQLLVMSIFCLLGSVRMLLWVLIVWGAVAIVFSLIRTWQRLGHQTME